MKKLLFLFALVLAAFTVDQSSINAQVGVGYDRVVVNNGLYVDQHIDTLTNTDTVINYLARRDYANYYELVIQASSLSGTALDTIYLEEAKYVPSSYSTPSYWNILETHAVSTANSTWKIKKSGNTGPAYLRVRTKSTGTQSTEVRTYFAAWRKTT